jgi:predicted  nucleic acid-binding Zn-ribbon protein
MSSEESRGVRDQLKALVKLAEIDSLAKDIDDRLKGIPLELEERRQGVRRLEDLVTRQKAGITEAERLFSSQEQDLVSRNDQLGKSRSKSAKARTMREAEAAERELETVRRTIKDGEAERDRLKERIEKTRAGLGEPEKALAEQKADLEAAETAATGKLSELRIEREKTLVGRSEIAAKIDKQYLRTYEKLRTKLSPAVAEAAAETCTACRISIAPNRFLQLTKSTEIMTCMHCMRILYVKSAIAD